MSFIVPVPADTSQNPNPYLSLLFLLEKIFAFSP